jgi:hypothetical protein
MLAETVGASLRTRYNIDNQEIMVAKSAYSQTTCVDFTCPSLGVAFRQMM